MSSEVEVTSEISGLRKEIFEVRNLVIKTDNLLKTFHIELKDVARKQQESEKRHFVGHIAAYIAITVIAVGGAALYGSVAASGSRSEGSALLEQARKKLSEAEAAQQAARERVESTEKANAEAVAIWELINSSDANKQQQGLERASGLDASKLSTFARSVIETTAGGMRRTRAEEAFNAGMVEYKRNNIGAAKAAFERFFVLAQGLPAEWKKNERLQASFHLGAAYNALGNHQQAIERLQLYARYGDSSSNRAYSYLLLGDSLEATRQKAEAEKAYRAGLESGPSGYTASSLRRRLTELPGIATSTPPAAVTPQPQEAAAPQG